MFKSRYDEHAESTLKPFAEVLQSEYYDNIEALRSKAEMQLEKIKMMENDRAQTQYMTQCEQVISGISKYIDNRRAIYLPYIHELSEKVATNHNCSTCSGGCSINHDMRILELTATNDEMKRVLSKLQMISFPLYSDTLFPDEYRLLRSNMTLLETALTELFFLENNYLVPKIAEAQKRINAGSK